MCGYRECGAGASGSLRPRARGWDHSNGSHSVAGHQALEDQPARALTLSLAGWRSAAQLSDLSSEGSGSAEAVLEASLIGNPRCGEVVGITQVGPHAAEQYRHPTFRILDGQREGVFLSRAAGGGCRARRAAPAPHQGGGEARSKWRRGRTKTRKCPEQIRQDLALWEACDAPCTAGTQSSSALLRGLTVARFANQR